MAEFKSYKSYRNFAHSVTHRWRFSRGKDQVEFLNAVLETSISRQEVIPAGAGLFRAQLVKDPMDENLCEGAMEQGPTPFVPERMKPRANLASGGRANPKGIPCLYTATHEETAIAEVRPWIGMHVSIACFELTRKVRVVNCVTDDDRIMIYFGEPEIHERERAVWRDIDRAMSRPVNPSDDQADYAPTQVIAEFFRERGLDGVAYGSSLGPGHNIALFDVDVARLTSCGLVQIQNVKLDHTVAQNQYFMEGLGGSSE